MNDGRICGCQEDDNNSINVEKIYFLIWNNAYETQSQHEKWYVKVPMWEWFRWVFLTQNLINFKNRPLDLQFIFWSPSDNCQWAVISYVKWMLAKMFLHILPWTNTVFLAMPTGSDLGHWIIPKHQSEHQASLYWNPGHHTPQHISLNNTEFLHSQCITKNSCWMFHEVREWELSAPI